MNKYMSTRDTLLALRQFVSEDEESAAVIAELTAQLSDAAAARAARMLDVLCTLEDYIDQQSEIHGFSADLERLVVVSRDKQVDKQADQFAVAKPKEAVAAKKSTKKPPAKKPPAKKQKVAQRTNASGPAKAKGYPGSFTPTRDLSEKEQQFVDILIQRWPMFTTPKLLVRMGALPAADHVSTKVNSLRNKGVPIQSARQARLADESVGDKAIGYRLIHDEDED